MSRILKDLSVTNSDDRRFSGWASVEVVDKEGELIPIKELEKVMSTWMKRGAPLTDQHSNRVIGRGLNWQVKDKDGNPGILIEGEIHRDYKTDDEVWEGIKSGKKGGLSFGGASNTKDLENIGGKTVGVLRDLEAHEVAIVDEQCNQESTFEDINMLAKGVKQEFKTKEELKEAIKQNNPWAICTASVGRDDKDKFERCVQDVKERTGLKSETTYKAIIVDGNRILEAHFPDGTRQMMPIDISKVSPEDENGADISKQEEKMKKLAKQETEEDKKPEEEKKKQVPEEKPEEEKPTEEKKKQEDLSSQIIAMLTEIRDHLKPPAEPEIADAMKQGSTEVTTTEEDGDTMDDAPAESEDTGKVKLPKDEADDSTVEGPEPAGQDAETDEEQIMEKQAIKIAKMVRKELGIKKSRTPRVKTGGTDIHKAAEEKDPAMNVLKSFKTEKTVPSWADIERDRMKIKQQELADAFGG